MISITQMAASATLGAFIGYVTNAIAIKSLFRPLRPRWYTLGWQGVIPRNREKMAENISRVVGQDLLGQEYLLEQVRGAALQESMHDFIAARIAQSLDLSLAALFARLPPAWQEQGLDEMVRRGLELLSSWSAGEAAGELKEHLLDVLEEHLRAVELARVVPPTQAEELVAAMSRVLTRRETREQLREILQEQIEVFLNADTPLEDLAPAELRELLHAGLRERVPALMARLASWLEAPENVEHLSDRILLALETYADQEGLLARLVGELGLRFFREQIRAAIRDRLPRVAHEYLHILHTRRQVEEQLINGINRFLRRPVRELAGRHGAALAEKLGFIAGTWLSSAEVQERLAGLLMNQYQNRAGRRLDTLLPTAFWEEMRHRLRDAMQIPGDRIPPWSTAISAWLRARLRQSRTPLRSWAGMRPEDEEALVHRTRDRATELLRTEVPVLLAQFDITRMVRTKIRGFDLLEVERLIKGIISDQLRFINLIGAVLGALVGLLLPFLNAFLAAANL